jgi:hypothetical protein
MNESKYSICIGLDEVYDDVDSHLLTGNQLIIIEKRTGELPDGTPYLESYHYVRHLDNISSFTIRRKTTKHTLNGNK